MQWTPEECLRKFHALSQQTFQKNGNPVLQRLQSLLRFCVEDSLYKSWAIDTAFQSACGVSPKMFNPLNSDLKVAVIAAPVKG